MLVERGLFASRARAQAAIEAGAVSVDGIVAKRPAASVHAEAAIVAQEPHPYVSRGGVKLAHALDFFGIDCAGRVVIDVGASTGGFTDVVLSRGARRVFAVDVGRDQLAARLRADQRVVALEETDARSLTTDLIDEAPDLLVCDASFIPLALILPRPLSLLAPSAAVVLLVKPQFEVGREHIGKRGVVRQEDVQAAAVDAAKAFVLAAGFEPLGATESPIRGGEGNREWFVAAVRRWISPDDPATAGLAG